MKTRTWLGAVVVVALAFTAAGAATPGVCTKENGKKVQCTDFRPKAEPSPTPTATPAPTPPLPECHDNDRFGQVSEKHWRKRVELEVGAPRTLCVDLPPRTFPFFEIYTINLSNLSCSNLEMTAIGPDGSWGVDVGPSPVLRPNSKGGRWLVKLYLPWGCTKYEFNIAY